MIDIWYGHEQSFGHLGVPQRWINILGRVDPGRVVRLEYMVNGGPPAPLTIGPDRNRLAHPGDFNVEIDHVDLDEGPNTVTLIATDTCDDRFSRDVILKIKRDRTWPLPYRIDWSQVSSIQDVAQVVDGRWALTPDGVRTLEPYYDRVIALGDRTWTDYEITATVTFHGLRLPSREDGGANVIHAALAVRWPGHDDDGNQPRIKWYPLGATAEFRVNPNGDGCSWRILGGGGICVESDAERALALNVPHIMKHRVQSGSNGTARYRVKLWPAGTSEPNAWDLEMEKDSGGVQSGGALLIAHYTDVTFGEVEAVPL